MKRFTTASGACSPQEHYLADITEKTRKVVAMVEDGQYITITRPPQYGKSHLLAKLEAMLSSLYCVLRISFQSAGEQEFPGDAQFVSFFMSLLQDQMAEAGLPHALISLWANPDSLGGSWKNRSVSFLRRKVRELCGASRRPIVLLIDDADRIANLRALLGLLAALRENYLAAQRTKEACFQSVVLASVHDIKTIGAGEYSSFSPWNIAEECIVDMSLSAEEIAGMLREYEADHQTGMDISEMASLLREATAGHPYLVSGICKRMDSQKSCASSLEARAASWTNEGFSVAVQTFLEESNPLLDIMFRVLPDHPDLDALLKDMLSKAKSPASIQTIPLIGWAEHTGSWKDAKPISASPVGL